MSKIDTYVSKIERQSGPISKIDKYVSEIDWPIGKIYKLIGQIDRPICEINAYVSKFPPPPSLTLIIEIHPPHLPTRI